MDLNALNDALAAQDWPTVAALGGITILTIVVTVLKLLGKDVPVVDKMLELLKGASKFIPKKAPAAKVEDQPGLTAVVPVREATPEEEAKVVELTRKDPPQS